jgi:pimeloyl-ACP methyl ester carboxylesterase
VLGVFGRFYAGGSWWQYAQDMVAGLRFLGTQALVDRARVGVIGGSLGGYEAFYAAAYAPPEVQPRAVVAMFPPVDLGGEEAWAVTKAPGLATTQLRKDQFATFFDPYLRRAAVDVGGVGAAGDYRCFAPSYVVPRVTGEVLVPQDEWDLLVDPALATDLLARLGNHGHPLWYRHLTPPDVDALPLDHGLFDQLPPGTPSAIRSFETFAYAFLHGQLTTNPFYVPYDQTAMGTLLTRWRDQQRAGLPQPGAANRLAELADARVTLYELNTQAQTPGPEGVAGAVKAIWGATIPADQIQAYLRTQGLPP